MTDLDRLAHEIAEESSLSALDCHSYPLENDKGWRCDVDMYLLRRELKYLEVRGRIERPKRHRSWWRPLP